MDIIQAILRPANFTFIAVHLLAFPLSRVRQGIQRSVKYRKHVSTVLAIKPLISRDLVNLRAHLKTAHVKCQFKCKQCDNVKDNHSDHLRGHFRDVHAKIKEYACDQCDYRTGGRAGGRRRRIDDGKLECARVL